MSCAVCGRPLPDGARFCSNCGTPVGPLVGTEERKVVTVLFADIVDSTGLARRLDPERSREVLGQFFDAAAEELVALRGRPEKFIGDAVMAVFGLPHVHEDDALRAVRAGLAIRARARRLGEAVGLAEPLQGRIRIGSGQVALGRGPSGQPVLVTVVGEPGIGKSRLADELTAGVGAAVVILRGQGRSSTDTATFSPAAAIIGDLAGIDAGDSPEKIRLQLRELVDRCCDPSEAARTVQRLAALFGLAQRPEGAAFLHDLPTRAGAGVGGLARDPPVGILLGDAHLLKAPMLGLIERLATRGPRGPRRALVLALARNELLEQRPDWGSAAGNAVLLRLDPLSSDESIRLVRQAGGSP